MSGAGVVLVVVPELSVLDELSDDVGDVDD